MQLQFRVDSALLRELGEKLVETVHLALAELVKNCYDADATEVEIKFSADKKGRPKIEVIDNGSGMSFDAVQNYWMRIATTHKDSQNVSKIYGRPLTGAKGIGRFCCRRLGNELKLITRGTSNGKKVGLQPQIEYTEVLFPWSDFIPGKDVTDIDCEGTQRTELNAATGTTLIISGLAEEWDTRGYNWLIRKLAVLSANTGAHREGFKPDPGFNVKLTAPDFEEGVRDIREDLFNAGWGTLTATINSKGQAVCKLEALSIGTRRLTSKMKFPLLQDISLKLGIMIDERKQMRDTSVLSKGSLAEILPEWGGVQVRFRGFRVYPYGDDDWLNIDHDRGLRKGKPNDELLVLAESLNGVDPTRALLTAMSMRSYVGSVNIGEDADGFEMKLNREGFVASREFEQLREFVRYVIHWATILHDFYLRLEQREESRLAREIFESILDQKIEPAKAIDAAVHYIETEVKTVSKILGKEEGRELEQKFKEATEVIRKQNVSNISELAHLRLVASTSTLLLIFSHEVKSLLGLLESSKNSLNKVAQSLNTPQRNVVLTITKNFDELKDRLKDLLQLTSLVGMDHRKAKPKKVGLRDKIERVEKVFSLITKKYNIELDYKKVPPNIMVDAILEAELYSILLNVLSNAIKSVIAGTKNRKIQLSARRVGELNVINIRDTGIGIHPSRYNEVFIPFISDPDGKLYDRLESRINPEDRMIVGSGSGLGLGIVKEIISMHNGNVRFVKPKDGWSADLEISLP